MTVERSGTATGAAVANADIGALLPVLRRVVRARVSDSAAAEDVVQETIVRVLESAERITTGMLQPYAIATARNLIASMWRQQDRQHRNQHRVVDLRPVPSPDEDLLARESGSALASALDRLLPSDRALLLAHEVSGRATRSLAQDTGVTAGAVAAQLNRARARLRVEYLLNLEAVEPPTSQCRPVLTALSLGDRRRQEEAGAAEHLLVCDLCSKLSVPLLERGRQRDDLVRVRITADADIVTARQAARELARDIGFSPTDLTVIATAVSEIARNIVRFAGSGEVVVEQVQRPRRGLRVVARDAGPGIVDLELALADGYSTYAGLGLGLPGARRLMDEFLVTSEVGRGTTVTMTKWRPEE